MERGSQEKTRTQHKKEGRAEGADRPEREMFRVIIAQKMEEAFSASTSSMLLRFHEQIVLLL